MWSPHDKIPPHLLTGLRDSKAPVISIYYTGDSPNIDLTGTVLTLTEGATQVQIDLDGKSTVEVIGLITKTATAYTARNLLDVRNLGTVGLTLDLNDRTIDGGIILRSSAHVIKKLEETKIRLLSPYHDDRHLPWHVVVNRGHFSRDYNGSQWEFSIPEYYDQTWSSTYGKGYMDLEDVVAERISPRAIRVPRVPILWDRGNITITVRDVIQPSNTIRDVDIYNGIIFLNREYDDNDVIMVSYTYREDGYIYDGVNLNPTEFHNPAVIDRYILFYLLPFIGPNGPIRGRCIYHTEGATLGAAVSAIPSTEEPVMLLGAVQIRPTTRLDMVQLTDTRTRGGGVKDADWDKALARNREIMSVADHGFFDGHPYPGNMALFIDLPKSIRDLYETNEIDTLARKFVAYGSYLFIDYVETTQTES